MNPIKQKCTQFNVRNTVDILQMANEKSTKPETTNIEQ